MPENCVYEGGQRQRMKKKEATENVDCNSKANGYKCMLTMLLT